MGLLIETSDFVEKFKISEDSFTELESYIDRFEPKYLKELLGKELFDLFEADITNHLPGTPIYEIIFEEIYPTVAIPDLKKSLGMKDMLLGFIYFQYMRDLNYSATVSGAVKNVFENSEQVVNSGYGLYQRYNESVESYKAIQHYINTHSTDYPTFFGECKDYISPAI